MPPAEADRTYLIYCHYLEMTSSPPSRLLNRTLFASESAMKMLALPCRCQNHHLTEQTLLVAVEVSKSTSVTLSQTKMFSIENNLNLGRNLRQISRSMFTKAERISENRRVRKGLLFGQLIFLFPITSFYLFFQALLL